MSTAFVVACYTGCLAHFSFLHHPSSFPFLAFFANLYANCVFTNCTFSRYGVLETAINELGWADQFVTCPPNHICVLRYTIVKCGTPATFPSTSLSQVFALRVYITRGYRFTISEIQSSNPPKIIQSEYLMSLTQSMLLITFLSFDLALGH